MNDRVISTEVNGEQRTATVPVRMLLSDFLRHTLGLTGTHVGCEQGVCGACTVQLDGEPVRACLLLAVQADRRTVRTVEGLADHNGPLHPLQEAFHTEHGLQCGFCTAGFLMSTEPLLAGLNAADDSEVREALSGNICRCTGYQGIIDAVRVAARSIHDRAAKSGDDYA